MFKEILQDDKKKENPNARLSAKQTMTVQKPAEEKVFDESIGTFTLPEVPPEIVNKRGKRRRQLSVKEMKKLMKRSREYLCVTPSMVHSIVPTTTALFGEPHRQYLKRVPELHQLWKRCAHSGTHDQLEVLTHQEEINELEEQGNQPPGNQASSNEALDYQAPSSQAFSNEAPDNQEAISSETPDCKTCPIISATSPQIIAKEEQITEEEISRQAAKLSDGNFPCYARAQSCLASLPFMLSLEDTADQFTVKLNHDKDITDIITDPTLLVQQLCLLQELEETNDKLLRVARKSKAEDRYLADEVRKIAEKSEEIEILLSKRQYEIKGKRSSLMNDFSDKNS